MENPQKRFTPVLVSIVFVIVLALAVCVYAYLSGESNPSTDRESPVMTQNESTDNKGSDLIPENQISPNRTEELPRVLENTQKAPASPDLKVKNAVPAITLKYFSETGAEVSKSDLPTVSLTYPTGGEKLTVGSTHQITWDSSKTSAIKYILIRITQYNSLCASGADCSTLGDFIIENTPNTGSYMWNIADTSRGYSMPAGQYTISLQGVTDYTVHSYQNGTELRYSNYTTTANSGLVTISN